MKFFNWLSQRAIQKKDAIALIFSSSSNQESDQESDQEVERWTYSQLENQVNHCLERLQALGIKSGDRVGLLLTNHPRYIMLIHALAKCEAIAVFLNIRLTAEELRWQIEDSSTRYLFYDQVTQAIAKVIQIDSLILLPLALDGRGGWGVRVPSNISNQENLKNSSIDLENIQGVFYTSGTTGKPKGVPLTYNNHFYSAIASALNLGVEPNDNWLICMPLFHVGGLAIAWRSVINGMALTLLPKFDESQVLEVIVNENVTIISLVPTMLTRLLRHANWSHLQKLRAILLGGAPASQELIERCLELNLQIMPTYGMTETASQITTLSPHQVAIKQGSSGLPLFGICLRIVDDSIQDLANGAIGQILVKGASVMAGYLNQSEHKTMIDGWLHTGDLGYLDDDGYLYVVSRRSDLIISGGENIYPTEIEAILLEHPAIAEVCVLGISDREWGEAVVAVIVVAVVGTNSRLSSAKITLEEIRCFCEQKSLARYKLPKSIYIWESLPKSASGKLLRQAIREQLSALR